jgi:hypothetical protein
MQTINLTLACLGETDDLAQTKLETTLIRLLIDSS